MPADGEVDPTLLWLVIFGWQTYAEGILGQRLDTAACLAVMRKAGVIR